MRHLQEQVPRILPSNRCYGNASYIGQEGRDPQAAPHMVSCGQPFLQCGMRVSTRSFGPMFATMTYPVA